MIPYTTGAFIVALLGAMAAALRNLVPARCGGPVAALLLLAYFAGVCAMVAVEHRHRRKLTRVSWSASRHFSRPRRWEISDDGILSSDEVSHGAYR